MRNFFDNLPGELEDGERLLVDKGAINEIACLNYDLSQARYTVSSREAAEVLADHAVRHAGQDLLVLPMLFTYRHWLELTLKEPIVLRQRFDDEPPKWPRTRPPRFLEGRPPGD